MFVNEQELNGMIMSLKILMERVIECFGGEIALMYCFEAFREKSRPQRGLSRLYP